MATWTPPGLRASADAGLEGSRFNAVVNFTNITFYANNPNQMSLIFTPEAGSAGITLARIKIDLNGINVIDNSNYRSSSGVLTFTISSPITTVYFYGYCNASRDGLNATAVLDTLYNVQYINTANDFVFVDTSPASLSRFLFLPVGDGTRKNLLFIKDKSGNANSKNITVTASSGDQLETLSNRTFTINSNWGCLILMLNYRPGISSYWHIANSYTNNIFRTSYQNEPSAGDVNKQTITIFNTDKTNGADPDRKNGDNLLTLSAPAASTVGANGIAIVVYCGSNAASRLNNGNVLKFRTNGSFNIDGFTAYQNDLPYIYCDDSNKSVGIVFICDSTQWYIAGWMYPRFWTWEKDVVYSNVDIPAAVNSFCANSNTEFGSNYIKLYNITNSDITVIKNYAPNTYSFISCVRGGNTNYFMNENYTSIKYGSPQNVGDNQLHCVWFIKEPRPLVSPSTYHFHPILSYPHPDN